MSAATFDDSQWPLVTVRYEGGMSEAELDAYLDGLRGLVARGKFTVIFDMTKLQSCHPDVLNKWRTWFSHFGEAFSTSCKGAAYVVRGIPSRAEIHVIGLQHMTCPFEAHATAERASKWLAQQAG